ncbi:hypothetical protein RhiJN_17698 [Ceratobasidium sp. AG-Ba]|nr:hypothetical protein RhiJN_17698 [Ceratobasidium sp. AG-Ba]
MARVSPQKTKSTRAIQHASKPAQKSKAKSSRNTIVSPTKAPRGPLLVTYFPVDDVEKDDDPAQVPQSVMEFRKLYTPYAKIKVLDSVTGENTFGGDDELVRVNDFIHIRAGQVGDRSVEDNEQWHAQVREIGVRKEPGWPKEDVCLVVAWFYTREMLDDRPISRHDRKLCDNMMENELIPSDHTDVIHLSSIMGKVDVTFFNEHSHHQPEIGPTDFFYRRRLIGNNVVMAKDTCKTRCKATYDPNQDVQHYCPRDQCCRWYHVACMTPDKQNEDDYRLVGYNISSVEQLLVDLVYPEAGKKKAKPRSKLPYPITNPSSETEPEEDENMMHPISLQAAYAAAELLPSRIRTLATLGITRGMPSGNGIVGNVWVVTAARYLARQVIAEGKPLDEEEAARIMEAADEMNSGNGLKLTPLAFDCPGCGSPI